MTLDPKGQKEQGALPFASAVVVTFLMEPPDGKLSKPKRFDLADVMDALEEAAMFGAAIGLAAPDKVPAIHSRPMDPTRLPSFSTCLLEDFSDPLTTKS